ncbi:hypothetical protein [Hyalangium versicolor]|uniref:hypothetical protein n=1 Tax=Hyalangium versicolor TaxID=2861190 RepID=UPI001CCF2DB1|nr:hypothetical protein [Hyalangium versicolor]
MLLVLASRYDLPARKLVQRWTEHGAALVTPDDLCAPGWRYDDGPAEELRALIGGVPLRAADLRGVYVRLPAVTEGELALIRGEERAYVAAELTAFLLAWLTRLPCSVINRPRANSLAGPAWRPEQWLHAANREGLPVVPLRRSTSVPGTYAPGEEPTQPGMQVTVVGQTCLGEASPEGRESALRLARAAEVEVLAVQLTGPWHAPAVAGAHVFPDPCDPPVADALLTLLLEGERKESKP